MLFHLAPSIAKNLTLQNQEVIDFVVRLLDSRKRGLLLINASRATFRVIETYFQSQGRTHEAELTSTISKKWREKRAIAKDISKIVFVTVYAKEIKSKGSKLIVASPRDINRSNMLYPPIMLGENLTDCELYVNSIASKFTDGLPATLKNLKLSDRFEPGGGNPTYTLYRRHKNRKIDLCFCIVDSDRKCPDQGLGDTAKLVAAVDAIVKSPLCDYKIIDMYSAENLLPITEIERHFCIGKSADELAKFELTRKIRELANWQYLPLKKGIRGNELKGNSASAVYWRKTLSEIGIPLPCCDAVECGCSIIPAIPEKTLADSVTEVRRTWENELDSEKNSNVRDLYRSISFEVRSWLCVGNEIRV